MNKSLEEDEEIIMRLEELDSLFSTIKGHLRSIKNKVNGIRVSQRELIGNYKPWGEMFKSCDVNEGECNRKGDYVNVRNVGNVGKGECNGNVRKGECNGNVRKGECNGSECNGSERSGKGNYEQEGPNEQKSEFTPEGMKVTKLYNPFSEENSSELLRRSVLGERGDKNESDKWKEGVSDKKERERMNGDDRNGDKMNGGDRNRNERDRNKIIQSPLASSPLLNSSAFNSTGTSLVAYHNDSYKGVYKSVNDCNNDKNTNDVSYNNSYENTNESNTNDSNTNDNSGLLLPFNKENLPEIFQNEEDLNKIYFYVFKRGRVTIQEICREFKEIASEKLEIFIGLLCRRNFIKQREEYLVVE